MAVLILGAALTAACGGSISLAPTPTLTSTVTFTPTVTPTSTEVPPTATPMPPTPTPTEVRPTNTPEPPTPEPSPTPLPPPTPTPIPPPTVAPTPTEVPPTVAPVEAPVTAGKPAWARFNENDKGECLACYGIDYNGNQRLFGYLEKPFSVSKPDGSAWGGRGNDPIFLELTEVTDNGDNTVTLKLRAGEGGEPHERVYYLQHDLGFVFKAPLTVPDGPTPLIQYFDQGSNVITPAQKLEILTYYAEAKMLVGVRKYKPPLTDYIILPGFLGF